MNSERSESGSLRLDSQRWWTETDRAELAARTWEFVHLGFEHKACRACAPWCDVLFEEFERLLLWRQARIIASKAEYLSALAYERRRHSA